MATATDILTLTQWFSPSFPIGAFAYSHGLEWAINSGSVETAENTRQWIDGVLRFGAGWNDCLLLAASYRAHDAQALAEIDATSRALCASQERLQESDLQGAAFCKATSALCACDLAGLTYPVAAGQAARLENLPLNLTAKIYLQSFTSNLAAVAMRLVPLGQSDGQSLIRDLIPTCIKIADTAIACDLDELNSTAFLSDISSMKHETQYSRIFRS